MHLFLGFLRVSNFVMRPPSPWAQIPQPSSRDICLMVGADCFRPYQSKFARLAQPFLKFASVTSPATIPGGGSNISPVGASMYRTRAVSADDRLRCHWNSRHGPLDRCSGSCRSCLLLFR